MRRTSAPESRAPEAPAHLSPWPLLAIVLAFWIAGADRELLRASHWAQYTYLADAFLHGSLHLVRTPNDAGDMAVVNGHLYVVFGPFPALLLMPLVPIFARQTPDVLVLVLTALAGIRAFHRWLERAGAATQRLTLACATLTLALGTALHYGAPMANVWLHAQITALALQCIALALAADGRSWGAGTALGLTVLTRPTVTLAAPLVAWELARARERRGDARGIAGTLIPLGAPLLAAIALHGVYNWARFGSPLDAGYTHILMGGEFEALVANWGRFNLHFLGSNLYGWLLRTPHLEHGRLVPDGHGMSLLITTPFLLLALWPRRWTLREWVALACAVAIALPSLLYYNDGWVQFGQRFALDFMPLALFLAARGADRAPRAVVIALTVWGIAIGAWGLQWFRSYQMH